MDLTDLEKKKLERLRKRADEYYLAYNRMQIEQGKMSKLHAELFGPNGAFEKFWAPIRKREIEK